MHKCRVCHGQIRKDRHPKIYCSKKCQAEVEGWSESTQKKIQSRVSASTSWRPQPPEPTRKIKTAHPTLIISDPHCPIHSEKWFYQALTCGLKFGCKVLIINGDLIDANQCSRHLGKQYRRKGELNDDIESARCFIETCLPQFDEIYITLGNHDQRLLEAFSGEISAQNLMRMIYSDNKVFITEKFFVELNGVTRVYHPRNYSKTKGKLPQDTAQRYQRHIISGHTHHSATASSADGKWQAVEVGCLMDTEWAFYAQQGMPNMPEMMEGFCIALPHSENDLILNFNKFTPWARFGLPVIR